MTIRRHSLRINGHLTSVSLEDPFWDELRRAAAQQGKSLNSLVAEIDTARTSAESPENIGAGIDAAKVPGLSSALRLYVLDRLRREARRAD